MDTSRRAAVAVLGALALLASSAAAAPPGSNTHLGQPASNSVTLEVHSPDAACAAANLLDVGFHRILPNGDTAEFAGPPANQVLVVTDLDFQWNAGVPGSRQVVTLAIVNPNMPSRYSRVFEATITLDANGEGGTSVAATSGFVAAHGTTLCVGAYPRNGVLNHLLVRGYFAPAQ